MSADVRTLLHDLAADAPRGRGEETADLVVDLHRAQDRRRLRWAGVAVAIAVVVAVVPVLVDRSGPTDASAVAAGGTTGVESLFDAPTRGSLADDPDAVAVALGASWQTGIAGIGAGQILDPAPGNRHVAFIGEVRDGQVWALVMGRTSGQFAYAWFVDSDPTDGLGLQLAGVPTRTTAAAPIGLLDVAGGSGYLVVVARLDDQVRYSPAVSSLFTADTSGFQDLPSTDGVTQTGVELPPTGVQAAPGISAVGEEGEVPARWVDSFDSSRPFGPSAWTSVESSDLPSDPSYGPLIQRCMVDAGWGVSVSVNGSLSFDGLLTGEGVDAFWADLDRCETSTGYR